MANVSQKLIGYRVKAARDLNKLSQAELARALSLNDRQSISDIEKGKRALKPDELVKLTEVLDKDIEFFIDPFIVAGEAEFSWRVADEVSAKSLDDFEVKAGRWIGLFRWLKEYQAENQMDPLKVSLKLNAQSSFEDAINRAEALANKLELGLVPAENLIDNVEKKLDIPVLFVDTIETSEGKTISGATCHLQDMGVILINRNEPEARRFYDLAHELFHALTWDSMKPFHRESNSIENRKDTKRIEQLADNFAAALLMPKYALEHHIDKNRLQEVEYLFEISNKLHVSPIALAYRLFNLKWIDEEIRNKLKDKHHHYPSSSPLIKAFSKTFISMLHAAIACGNLSARKAAKTIGINLPQLAGLFSEHSLSVPFEM